MKKLIIVVTATLLMTSAFAESNKTSIWSDMKNAASSFTTDVKEKYEDTNFTAIKDAAVIKTKTAVDATKEVASNLTKATKIKYLEVKYPELMVSMADIWQRGQFIDDDESFVKILSSFNELVGKVDNDPEKKELVLSRIEEFISMRNPDKD